jgi:uncharacterized membrane protein YeaQ/YmgE (transglycosylase-associated protein family)
MRLSSGLPLPLLYQDLKKLGGTLEDAESSGATPFSVLDISVEVKRLRCLIRAIFVIIGKQEEIVEMQKRSRTSMVMTIIWWLIVGLIAGFLASLVMRGGGYGVVGDIIVGLVGALIGGFLANLLGLGASGMIGTIIVAFIGACILIALLHAFSGSTRRTL